MKILYAIQGTGNGHISRALDIIPALQQKGELDILISGTQADVELPFAVKYRFRGMSFIFGKKGSVDLLETYKKSNLKKLYSEIKSLPVKEYDLIINDFEPVSAWACFIKKKECISLSHQCAVINKRSPRPEKFDPIGKAILKNYAPVTESYGFHFKEYDKNIFTPVIRNQVRKGINAESLGHYTVYLPAYGDKEIISLLETFSDIQWQVFSKHSKKVYLKKNVSIRPVNNEDFLKSLLTCTGVLCGAGFETPAEALFLKKKLMVIPMKNQFEQYCNAAALKKMGVPVLKSLKQKHADKIKNWINSRSDIIVDYPDKTENIINAIVKKHAFKNAIPVLGNTISSLKKFKNYNIKNIIKSR